MACEWPDRSCKTVPGEVRIHQRRQHALVGINSRKKNRCDIQVAKHRVQTGVVKAAHPVFVNADIRWLFDQFIHHGSTPRARLKDMVLRCIARRTRQGIAQTDRATLPVVNMQR